MENALGVTRARKLATKIGSFIKYIMCIIMKVQA